MATEPKLSRSTVPRVLFVGREASSPSIAASLLREGVGDQIAIDTASTQPAEPGGRSDEMLVAMGLNPADRHLLSSRAIYAADRVVVLEADLDVARMPGPRYEEWDIEQDDLFERVDALSADLTARPATKSRSSMMNRILALLRRTRHSPGLH
jgi:hypothetical protein